MCNLQTLIIAKIDFRVGFFCIYMIKLSRKTCSIFLHAPIHMKIITFQEMSFKLTEYLQQENGLVPFFLQMIKKIKMLILYFGDLKYKSFNHEYITHKSSHQKYNCPKKITDHTLGWAFDNVFFFIFN